ncbi:FkbM family methyltransferase [Agrobacterium salinitolerans]|uniref:FkbM family methyltransferase n=1 Tax=Agrobacterium salinitolerans TaxID=1183413 RepID=UPI001C21875F|nr:FkbM family methyltransferase [Agrobacterium salinitolerans]QXC49523.1 FkbM family methyltransferase [Agrobacterium salinitolerans]
MLSFWRKKKDHQAMQDATRELVDNSSEPASTPPKSELAEKSSLINPAARGAAIDIGGVVVPLDLSYRHERDYFARHFLGAPHPLADLDRLIFHRFVRQGDVVLDAGANIGVTIAELLEAGAAHVHAFEAVPSLYRRIAAISDPRFTGYACALGDGEGTIPIWVSQTHNQGSTIDLRMVEQFAPIFGEKPVSEDVPLKRLDDACQGIRFDFMKVDVEGAEAAFLRGAASSLSVNPPRAMSMELYDRFFDEAKKEADKYFSKCNRCFLLKSDYSLHLAAWSEPHDDDRYYLTAPTYVFTN